MGKGRAKRKEQEEIACETEKTHTNGFLEYFTLKLRAIQLVASVPIREAEAVIIPEKVSVPEGVNIPERINVIEDESWAIRKSQSRKKNLSFE
uniref:Uncharacterized protein n=1 Tax=Setaria digitata TaxID=48799 RepID=A0A915PK41_9BILA